jgi:hypothetical protein
MDRKVYVCHQGLLLDDLKDKIQCLRPLEIRELGEKGGSVRKHSATFDLRMWQDIHPKI